MTLWQDPPPQTRRQAREAERAAAAAREAAAGSRRAGTATPTTAGEIPAEVAERHAEVERQAEAERHAELEREGDATEKSATSFDDLLDGGGEPNTEGVFRTPAGDEEQPVTTPVAVVLEGGDRPLTRRELRARRLAEKSVTGGGDELSESQTEAIIDAEVLDAEPVDAELVDEEPVDEEPVDEEPVDEEPRDEAGQPAPAGAAFGLVPTVSGDEDAHRLEPIAVLPPAAEAPVMPAGTDDEKPVRRSSFQPPTGHWSIGVDEPQASSGPITTDAVPRTGLATGSITTSNALILPMIPSADATGPLTTSTGEVIVTGSVDLPRGLGSTGAHPTHFDSPAIDSLFDEADKQGATDTGAAPVRASKAVSTHASTRGVIAPPKARDGKLPAILAITAAVLAIGVIGLLVAGYVLHIF